MMSEVYDFDDLEPQQFPFRYKGTHYLCAEADAATAIRFRDYKLNAGKYEYVRNPNTNEEEARLVGYEDLNKAELLLVAGCVYQCDKDGRPILNSQGDLNPSARVGEDILRIWPNRVTGKLYQWIQEHSDLGEDTVEGLERQVNSLQKRLERLRKSQQGSLAKNGHSGGPTASSSPTASASSSTNSSGGVAP